MADIVEQYSGTASRTTERCAGDAAHMRIVVVDDDGIQREIFKGSKFSQEKADEEMKLSGRTSRLDPNWPKTATEFTGKSMLLVGLEY